MRKSLSWVLASLMVLSSPLFAQFDGNIDSESEIEKQNTSTYQCSVANILKRLYGNVIVEEDKFSAKLTLSVPRGEIENMLNMSLTDGWFPSSLVIKGMGGENSVVFLTLSKKENDSPRRFRVLSKLAAPGALPWKQNQIDGKTAYVTSIETDFGEDFLVKGETLKSNLIFKNLSPMITKIGADKENLDSERFSSKENFDRTKIFTRETYYDNDTGINGQPFFEHGTYKDDPVVGRYMIFTLRCKW